VPTLSVRRTGRKTAPIERLIRPRPWTTPALALVDLELPQWQVRRIAYDEGEWYCALSRARELPDWLDDRSKLIMLIAARDLGAFVDASTSLRRRAGQSVPPCARREPALRTDANRQFRVKPRNRRGYSAAVRTSARSALTAQNLNSGSCERSSAGLVKRFAAASA